jgi:hypothetical protein
MENLRQKNMNWPILNIISLSDQYVRFNDKCTHICYWLHYLHHVLCQITMSDLMMNAHTHALLITLIKYWCMSDQYVTCNSVTHMCIFIIKSDILIWHTTWYITSFVNDTDMLCYSMIFITTLVWHTPCGK